MGRFATWRKQNACNHKYRDFPWYIACDTKVRHGIIVARRVSVVEPYMCVKCGHRVDKVLSQSSWSRSSAYLSEVVDRFIRTYGMCLKPQAIVEDEIADALMVDREYLEVIDSIEKESSLEKEVRKKLS